MASELAAKLARRQQINEGLAAPSSPSGGGSGTAGFNPAVEFPEFNREQLKTYSAMFAKYDEDGSGKIDIEELKRMMEKLGNPQTHIGLRGMIKEVDEDGDDQISFREFLLIFRKKAEGSLDGIDGFTSVVDAASIDVDEVGVKGAKAFFDGKADKLKASSSAEAEIRREQEEKKKVREEAQARKNAFKEKIAAFGK